MTRRRPAFAVLAVALACLAPSACSGDDGQITATDDPAGSGRSGLPGPTTAGTPGTVGEPSDGPGGESGGSPTTAAGPISPPAALLDAVAAYRAELAGAGPVRALQLIVWFPETGAPYAALQSQDPDQPLNVDERRWDGAAIAAPQPVRLTGDGDLDAHLFSLDEIAWDAVAAHLAEAPGLVAGKLGRPLDDGRGVTHVIATSDLPFSSNTVVRVYVDGGARTTGGYVEYLADGTLGEVQA